MTGWEDPAQHLLWLGRLTHPGKLLVSVIVRLPRNESSDLKLSVQGQTLAAHATGGGDLPLRVELGSVDIVGSGYQAFLLEGVKKTGKTFGQIESLLLSGPAAKDSQFNLLPRRNAASVHLGYAIPKGAEAEWFYNELTVRTDPLWSYYMACGFSRGYFGIQVNSPTERRILFSIWDSGNEGVDRAKVRPEDRVQLLAKGDGVWAGDFGNEGTGGHSHLIYPWKKDETYRFLVRAQPEGAATTYTGYFFFPEKKAWGLIASFRAPKDGKHLRGLYSFNENFAGQNGQLRRLAEFGPGWIRSTQDRWLELLEARFSHDPTGAKDRFDYAAGVSGGHFYLSSGGGVAEPVQKEDRFERPATRMPPDDALPGK
ncbi:MAG TPA: DUF3472 domain-containing protein [Planctomycetota bacterium]|nr:DUF3472 domain-containing protein [Planctomycetota bacterium]